MENSRARSKVNLGIDALGDAFAILSLDLQNCNYLSAAFTSKHFGVGVLRELRKERGWSQRPEQIWQRIYPVAIPNYSGLTKHDQRHARQILRERVQWRRRTRMEPRGRRPGSRGLNGSPFAPMPGRIDCR